MAFSTKLVVLVLAAQLMSINALPYRASTIEHTNGISHDIKTRAISTIGKLVKGKFGPAEIEEIIAREEGLLEEIIAREADILDNILAREPGFMDDDIHLEARGQGPRCQPLTLDDAKRMPGWSQVEKYANDNYGRGKYTIVTNPSDYPDRAATICAPLNPVPLKVNQAANACSTSTLDVGGGVTGTSAQVGVKQRVGVKAETSMSVSRSSVFSTSLSFGVSIGIPSIGLGASASTSMSSTVSNKSTQSFKSSFDNMSEISLSFHNQKNKKCAAKIHSKTCQATATGEVPLVASGYIWFNYDDAREGKRGGGKHFKWAVRIEDAIKNPADRSSSIQFSGNFKSTSNTQGKYDVTCK